MTPAEAQAIQNEARRKRNFIMWFVRFENGQAIATGRRADRSGGATVGKLVADTLDELRAMLPIGLTRREPSEVMAAGVVETWD